MNLMARPCDLEPDPALDADLPETDCGWLMQRVVNALLREGRAFLRFFCPTGG